MAPPKRYKPENALRQFVSFAEDPYVSTALWLQMLTQMIHADTGVIVFGDSAAELREWGPGDFMNLRNQLRTFLRRGLKIEKRGHQLPTFHIEFAPVIVHGNVKLTVDGNARDVLWYQAVSLIRMVGLGGFRQCECGRVFAIAKHGPRKYCSSKCQKRFYMRRFRSGETDRE